jgi:hypothetical protein
MNPQEKSKSKPHPLFKSLSKKGKSSASLQVEKQNHERPLSDEEILEKLITYLHGKVQKGGDEM